MAQITPVGVLLSVLVVFGLMCKNNEIVALNSSGISVYALIRPIIAMGVFASVALFFLSEALVPITMGNANRIWLQEVRHESLVTSKEKNIWVKGNRSIVHIKYYNPAEKTIFGVSLTVFDESFQLVRRVDAKQGIFQGGSWHLHDVVEQNLQATGDYKVVMQDMLKEKLSFQPDDLKRVIKKSEEMSFNDLWAYIRKVEAEGYDAAIYKVDLQAKVALPFVCIIMTLIGTGIGIRGNVKEGLPVSITYGIGIAFLYWVIHSFCLSLGYGEMLPPFVAAWTANLLFLCFGVILVLNAE